MFTESKELDESSLARLSYEVVIQSVELASPPKDSLFSIELSKGSINIKTNRKFTIDDLTRQTSINETFSFYQDQGGILGARDKQAEVRILIWKEDRCAIVAKYKLILSVCACKCSEAPFQLENGDQVFSRIFYSVKCRKHIVKQNEAQQQQQQQQQQQLQQISDKQTHRAIEQINVEGKDRDPKKLEKTVKIKENQRSKSVGKSSGNMRISSLEQDKQQQKQQEQLRTVTKKSVDYDQHLNPINSADGPKKNKSAKNPVHFTSFWRVNIDRSQTPRPQTERTYAYDTNQSHSNDKGKAQTQREQQIQNQTKEDRHAIATQPNKTKLNTPSVQQHQIVQPLKQQQKGNQLQEDQQSFQNLREQANQGNHKISPGQLKAKDQNKQQRQVVNSQIAEQKQNVESLITKKKQLGKDIQNTTKNDSIEFVTPNMKNKKIKNSQVPKKKNKTVASTNANVFQTPKTKIPIPVQLPICGSSQYSSESSGKNSFFSDQSSCQNIPKNDNNSKDQSANKQETQRKKQRDQQANKIHKNIISQLIGETPEQSKVDSKSKKGVFVSEEMKRKIQQLSRNGYIIINNEEENEEQVDKEIENIDFKNEIDIHNESTNQTQEDDYQPRPSLTRMKDFKRKKLNEIEQLEDMILQMKLEGDQTQSKVSRHNGKLEKAEYEAQQDSHIDMQDETIPSEGESAEEDDSSEKKKKQSGDNKQASSKKKEKNSNQNDIQLQNKPKEDNISMPNINTNTKQPQNLTDMEKEEDNTVKISAELTLARHALLLSQQEKQLMSQQIEILRQQNTDLQSQIQSAASNYIHSLGQLQSENASLVLRVQTQMRQFISQSPPTDTESALKKLIEQNNQLRKESIGYLETIKQQKDEIERLLREIQDKQMEISKQQKVNEQIQQSDSSRKSAQIEDVIELKHNTNEQQQLEEIKDLKNQLELLNQRLTDEMTQNEKDQTKGDQIQNQHTTQELHANLIIDELQSKLTKLNLESESKDSKIADLQQHLSLCQIENQKLNTEMLILKNQPCTFGNNPFSLEVPVDQQQQQLIQTQAQQTQQISYQKQQQIQYVPNILESQTQPSEPQNTSNNDKNIHHNTNVSSELRNLQEQSKKLELNLQLNKELVVQKQQELDKLKNLYNLYYQKAHNLEQINQNLEFELLQTKQDFCEALNVTFEKGGNDLLDIIERNVSFREYKPKISEFR